MHKILTLILILLYVGGIIQPFMPYIDYQINMEYYATVTCENIDKPHLNCNGKCTLAKNLEVAAKKAFPETPEAPNSVDKIDILGSHIFISYTFRFISTFLGPQNFIALSFINQEISPPTPPPRLLIS